MTDTKAVGMEWELVNGLWVARILAEHVTYVGVPSPTLVAAQQSCWERYLSATQRPITDCFLTQQPTPPVKNTAIAVKEPK